MTDVMLSPDQTAAYLQVVRWIQTGESLLTLGGYAGTGKTTLLSLIAREIGHRSRIAFAAPTGRAASVLERKLRAAGVRVGIDERHSCSTLHSLVARPVENPETGEIAGWSAKGELGGEGAPPTLIVIDEASMCSADLFEMVRAHDIPILAVGDHGQLPPVMSTLNLMQDPDIRLERIHRQAEESPILRLATKIREGGAIDEWDGDDEAVTIRPKREWREVIRRLYLDDDLDVNGHSSALSPITQLDRVILCQTNHVRTRFNIEARTILERGSDPETGDLVVCLKNIKHAGVYNGFRGFLLSSPKVLTDHVTASVSFPSERLRFWARMSRHQFGQKTTFKSFAELSALGFEVDDWRTVGNLFDYAYAMTVHKAQGSEWPLVVVCREEKPLGMSRENYRRWLYTAVTRASERLVVLG